jgi:hypothetical protein
LRVSKIYFFLYSAPSSSHGIARVHGSDAQAIQKRATNGTGVPFLFEVQGTGLSSTHGTAASMLNESECLWINKNIFIIQNLREII